MNDEQVTDGQEIASVWSLYDQSRKSYRIKCKYRTFLQDISLKQATLNNFISLKRK